VNTEAVSCTGGCSVCGAAGEWEIAEEAFRRRSEVGVRAASRTLSAMLLKAYLNARQWDSALRFMRYMSQHGEPPSPNDFNTFLRWVRLSPPPACRCWPESSRAAIVRRLLYLLLRPAPWATPALDVLRRTVHGRWRRLAAEAQQWDTVIHVYAETTRARAQLDEDGYRLLCRALHHSGRDDHVPQVLRDMSCAGFQYDAVLALPPLERADGS
jgi:pentatricopeptide repeat protein